MSASERVCLVTGASRGIGRAVAQRLVADGHRVALVARTAPDPIETGTLSIAADVTDPGDVERMFAVVENRWCPVEVLVSNAGSGTAAALVDTTDEQWRDAIDLNLTAPFRCVRRALPAMLDSGWGRIVVIASVVAKRGESQVRAYNRQQARGARPGSRRFRGGRGPGCDGERRLPRLRGYSDDRADRRRDQRSDRALHCGRSAAPGPQTTHRPAHRPGRGG